MPEVKVIILATDGTNTRLLFNKLQKGQKVVRVILEQPISKLTFLKRRMKKIGFFKGLSQAFFMTLIMPFITDKFSRERIVKANLSDQPIPKDIIHKVDSINSSEVIELLKNTECDYIIINGTRILKKSLLNEIKVPIVNIHTGITPKYRGVHGGYWALYQNEPELFGVTLHVVDEGVDTGTYIAQKVVKTAPKDNFKSYPTLQYLAGLDLLVQYQDAILNRSSGQTEKLTTESEQHYHPGFFQYLSMRLRKGVK
ncbi:MAG: formyl transferase [Crocinitomicaceae bacterium]